MGDHPSCDLFVQYLNPSSINLVPSPIEGLFEQIRQPEFLSSSVAPPLYGFVALFYRRIRGVMV